MKRRNFLQYAGLFSSASLISIGCNGWAAKTIATSKQPKRLIVIFLRGAADGLNIVIPYQDENYYAVRPRIAIPRPGETEGALKLDSNFGLHPALEAIFPLWQQKSLAFVHASGSPDGTRSHFDAQDYMESGTPGIKNTKDGWMNRLLATLTDHNPVRALNIGNTTPRILLGKMSVASIAPGKAATQQLVLDRPEISLAFDQLYTDNSLISQVYRDSQKARKILLNDLTQEMDEANNGAPLPNNFVGDAKRLAQLMVSDSNIQLAFLGLGGWDTHINQGSSQGQLANRLKPLGEGLAALTQGLGSLYQDTAIVVMSEFGRTVRENGNGGTDHGHGNVLWLMGGAIKGGKVYGEWLGLDNDDLYEDRDLPVLTDFRDAIAVLLEGHLQLNKTQIAQIFPNYQPKTTINLL